VASETVIEGPVRFDTTLAEPLAVRKVSHTLSYWPAPRPQPDAEGKFRRIENFNSSKSFAGGQDFAGVVPWPRFILTKIPVGRSFGAPNVSPRRSVVDISNRMDVRGACNGTCRPGAGWF